jgi:hypothetical protein
MKKLFKASLAFICLSLLLVSLFFPAEAHSIFGSAADGVSLGTAAVVTVYTKEVESNLFQSSDFMMEAKDDTAYVQSTDPKKGAATVSVPQAGASPTVVIGAVAPNQTVNTRDDDNLTYDIPAISTLPIVVQDAEDFVIAYDKRANIIEEHTNALRESIGTAVAYQWSPTLAAQIIRTSGSAVPSTSNGATGNRKKFTKEDILAAKTLIGTQNGNTENLRALMTYNMYAQLLNDPDIKAAQNYGLATLPTGVVDMIYGVQIRIRPTVCTYTNASTPVKKAIGAATASTDNEAVIVYDPKKVRFAKTGLKVFYNPDRAEHFGSVISAQMFGGGSFARKDQKCVVAIVQAASA